MCVGAIVSLGFIRINIKIYSWLGSYIASLFAFNEMFHDEECPVQLSEANKPRENSAIPN